MADMSEELNRILFRKGNIGKLELKNRVVMAPMGVKSDPDGGVCQREIDYYVERARGGVGMIITGRFATTEKYEMRSHHLLVDYHHVGRLALMAEKIHIYGSKLCVQIGPGLGRMVHQDPHTPPYSASAIPSFYYPNLMCRPYSVEDIHYLAWTVGNAAALAKRADCDAVELHAYGGYLLDQFMTPLYNKRTDEYGGSLENRMRFTMECIDEIRRQAGKDFPVIVKYTAYHGIPGGRELDEGIEMAKRFEAAGVDAIHVDKGCYERWFDQISTVYEPDCHQLEIAAAVQAAVNVPVISQGKLGNPNAIEKALVEKPVAFVALAHQSLSDPQWTQKVKDGRYQDIRPCVGCNECLNRSHKGKIHSCAVNPMALREADYPIEPTDSPKKVLVAGGGIAGMVAAIVLRMRGHQPEIWETTDRLGGLLLSAGAPDFKVDLMRYVDYLKHRIETLGIPVRLNTEASADSVLSAGFDHVIIATGSGPLLPPIPGLDGENVVNGVQFLREKGVLGGDIAVIGGGLVGLETAIYLKEQPSVGKVYVVEMQPEILYQADECLNNDQKLKNLIQTNGIQCITGARVQKITTDGVYYLKDGREEMVSVDKVVAALGLRSEKKLLSELGGKLPVTAIGNCVIPGKIITAVHAGFHTARLL